MKATFAGGCFWCIEAAFHTVKGVSKVTSGYTGGRKRNPTYHDVSTGKTGHVEAVQVEYDPRKIPYRDLVEFFWHNIDPTQKAGQFSDWGTQYQSAIFYHNERQKKIAEASKKEIGKSMPVETKILPAKEFYPAEEHHQNYSKKNPVQYHAYKLASGRGWRLKSIWKKRSWPLCNTRSRSSAARSSRSSTSTGTRSVRASTWT